LLRCEEQNRSSQYAETYVTHHIKALILDMDGVIWRSDTPIGDLPNIFRRIEERASSMFLPLTTGQGLPTSMYPRWQSWA